MDCNKEEATRLKKLAEENMRAGDFIGALKLVTEAQRLFPSLENIHQMIAICDVHAFSNKKIHGLDGNDWYGVLQVQPFADADTIKKQYRKLSLLLHPDNNKFAGAESAFKLVGEANMVLSDAFKRYLFDIAYRSIISNAPIKSSFPVFDGDDRLTIIATNFQRLCNKLKESVEEQAERIRARKVPAWKKESHQDREPEPETNGATKRSFSEVDGFDGVDLNDHKRRRAGEMQKRATNKLGHDAFMAEIDAKSQKYLDKTPINHSYTTVQEVAILWKGKIIRSDATPSSLKVLAFLQFLVAHRLHNSIINRDETAKLASSIAHHKEAPKLFQSLGIDSMIPEFQYIPAVRLICFFKLEGFSPLLLLKKEIVNLTTRSIQKTVSSQEEDCEKLRDVFELVANYKLEIDMIDIPGDLVVNLMVQR